MQPKKGSKSSLLLIELIITLFFFLLISAVCIQVFAKAYTVSQTSRELSHAQNLSASAAEVLETAGTSLDRWQAFFPEICQQEDYFLLFYDQNFENCSAEQAVYTLQIIVSSDEMQQNGTITFRKGEEPLYSLAVSYHLPFAPLAGKEAAS